MAIHNILRYTSPKTDHTLAEQAFDERQMMADDMFMTFEPIYAPVAIRHEFVDVVRNGDVVLVGYGCSAV